MEPPDFEAFWARTRRELAAVPAGVERERERVEDGLALERLRFGSLGGVRVGAYLLRADPPSPRPLVVHGHGYGAGCVPAWAWARAGLDVLGVDVRGHGRSAGALAEPSAGGYVLTGIDSPETSVLRGAACDYARAVEVGRALLPGAGRLVLQGASFAGALAVWAEALLGGADLLAVAVPTLGWPEGRRLLARAGSGGEIAAYLDRRPGREEDVMQVLAYFDTVSFAARVRCPALVGIGERDDVVPAPTSLAVARALGGPTEVMRFPVSHTDSPLERCWERFDERLIELAVHGPPVGFGAGRHAPMAAASRTHLS